jgi:hypothetical protein
VKLKSEMFKAEETKPKIAPPNILVCEHCGADYNPKDYRQDAPEWTYPQCNEILRKE